MPNKNPESGQVAVKADGSTLEVLSLEVLFLHGQSRCHFAFNHPNRTSSIRNFTFQFP